MRILIVSVTTGYGHHSTAAALAEEFRARGDEVVIEDLYEYCSTFMYNAMDKGYLFSTRHMKRQFAQAYNQLEKNASLRRLAGAISGNPLLCKKFAQFFHGYSPDIIIATHVFAAQVLNELKLQRLITAPLFGIVTDYCIHPFWEDLDAVDYIVTASELLSYTAVRRGIAEKRILPFGLPVRPQFLIARSREEACNELGIEQRPTVLIMGGSMGYGNMTETVHAALDCSIDELQVICICGNNSRLAEELGRVSHPRLSVHGFVNNVELFMDAADCIITKPGGLTVTELLVKQLPAILVNPIPGHEERNAEFLLNNGGAVRISPSFSAGEALHFIFSTPGRLELMRRSLALIAHPDAARRLCSFSAELVSSGSVQKA